MTTALIVAMLNGRLFLGTEFFSLPPFAITYETEDSNIQMCDATSTGSDFPIVQRNLRTEAASTTETSVAVRNTHDVTPTKTRIFINASVRTSNLAQL